jgi:hypothetical protein
VVVQGAVEGDLDAALLSRMARDCGLEMSTIYGRKGKDRLRRQIEGFNRAAVRAPWLVLVDLDDDDCAPALIERWLPAPSPLMTLRVAVREAGGMASGGHDPHGGVASDKSESAAASPGWAA